MPPHPPVMPVEIDGIIRHMAEQEAELRRMRRRDVIMRQTLMHIATNRPAHAHVIATTALVECDDA